MKIDLLKRVLYIFSILLTTFFVLILLLYFLFLPLMVKSEFFQKQTKNIVKNILGIDFYIEKPRLKTKFKPEIELEISNLILKKDENLILELKDFELEFNFKDVIKKQIELKELCIDKLTINLDKLLSCVKLNENKKNNNFPKWKVKLLNSEIELKEFYLDYLLNNGSRFIVAVNDAELKTIDNFKSLALESNAKIYKNNKNKVEFNVVADKQIKLFENQVLVEDLSIFLNNSNLKINSKISLDEIYINATSNKFFLSDIFDLINSDFIIPNGSNMLAPLNSPNGAVKFDVSLKNNDLSGVVFVDNTSAKLKDVSNLPLNISNGKIEIFKDKIHFDNLTGFYGKSTKNKILVNGDIKDYYKTFDSNITVESVITNEFFKDYLAKLINNTVLYVSKPSKTKIIYKSKNNIMDIIWYAEILKGVNFGISSDKSALSDYDRAILGEFKIKDDKFEIKNINYYITQNIVKGVKLTPIIVLNGLMDFSGNVEKIGMNFGREMPCEFLNVFIGQKLFKKGTIKGKIGVEFKDNIPYLVSDMVINKTLIPSQRLFVKNASIQTHGNLIKMNMDGRFKKANFNFDGEIVNQLKAPYVIKNLTLDIDNLDIEKVLSSFNSVDNAQKSAIVNDNVDEEILNQDDDFMFDVNLIRIQNCVFKLLNGNYKDLTFGNIKANLTLDDNGILKISSNKFDIAQGVSSLKAQCDLKRLEYYIRLGVKGINSSLMAKVLFNLEKEISGFADGLIELNGDKSLKMNGDVKFQILDGTIGKIGLVEYVLKIASVFRNPIVMVSPATIMDIVSIPEGRFDKIIGEIKIKDNILSMINIKSYSKSLSALIRGRMDLERHDASLRIYTRFSNENKAFFGFLRNLSLNTLANKVKINSRVDANYYASELKDLPEIEVERSKTQIFLTQVEGDVENFNFISSLKKIK